jgi:hypothetical protein
MVFQFSAIGSVEKTMRQLILITTFLLSCNAKSIGQYLISNPSLKNVISQEQISFGKLTYRSTHAHHYAVLLSPTAKKSNLGKYFKIVRSIDDRSFIIASAPPLVETHKEMFSEILPVNHLWKVSPNLLDLNEAAVGLFTVQTTDVDGLREKIEKVKSLVIIGTANNVIYIEGSYRDILDHVVMLDGVSYVGAESRTPVEESRVLDLNLNPNTVNRIHHEFPALNGENMTISIQELRYNINDIDLRLRDIPSSLNAEETSSHATDMATIAAGAGNSHVNGKGVAWAANITSSSFDDLLPDKKEDYETLNAWIQNHSYGTEIENFYGAMAEAYDQSANINTGLLHVFSSGNKGTETSASGAYQGIEGYANITGNYKMSKNTLTVGSVDTVGRPVSFSSRGPAYDGRIKPEVVAYSTAGSSNSAALVSGVVLLLQQAYKNQFGQIPPSALLKAILVNSATDVAERGPDYITGFGNVDSYRALQNLNAGSFLQGVVAHGQTKMFSLNIPANSKDLKITLVWNDPAAGANAGVALTNDLDLSVEDGNSDEHLPFILDFSANKTKLSLPATRGKDHRNNIEQVLIEDPAAGNYNIIVEGFDIPDGPQQFYIAYQIDTLDKFEWSFPTASDNIPYDGETVSYFQWRSTLTETFGRLEYTTDGGTEWKLIADEVDLANGYYRWQAPLINIQARARMVAGGETFETDAFTISHPVTMQVGFNCSDSVMLRWNAVKEAKEYQLYTLNSAFMEPVLTLTDTSVVLDKNEYSSTLFAVRPILDDNTKLIRSLTYNYELQSAGCFLSSFFALRTEQGIKLTTLLSTTYAVEAVYFERLVNDAFVVIGSSNAFADIVEFVDTEPDQSINTYRARVKLINGSEILSDPVQEYYLTNVPFILFPNPVSQGEPLKVYFKSFDNQSVLFHLFQSDGKQLKSVRFKSETEVISVSDLAPGLYYYSFITDEGRFSGKLVVR